MFRYWCFIGCKLEMKDLKDLKMKMWQYTFDIIKNTQQTICVYVTSAFCRIRLPLRSMYISNAALFAEKFSHHKWPWENFQRRKIRFRTISKIRFRTMQARFKKSLYWPFICSSYICLSHCFNASDPGPLFPNGNYSVSTTRIVVHVFGSPISTDLGLSTHQRIRLSEPLLSSVSCHVIPKLPALSNNAMCNWPFYIYGWKRGWGWPCFDTNLLCFVMEIVLEKY